MLFIEYRMTESTLRQCIQFKATYLSFKNQEYIKDSESARALGVLSGEPVSSEVRTCLNMKCSPREKIFRCSDTIGVYRSESMSLERNCQ